jgi:hypothetical protein
VSLQGTSQGWGSGGLGRGMAPKTVVTKDSPVV